LGCDQRRDGSVSRALSARAGVHARAARVLPDHDRPARLGHADLLVRAADHWRVCVDWRRRRRRGVLGARGRLRRRSRVRQAVRAAQPARHPRAVTLAAGGPPGLVVTHAGCSTRASARVRPRGLKPPGYMKSEAVEAAGCYTLNLKSITSPSWTTYSLPSMR